MGKLRAFSDTKVSLATTQGQMKSLLKQHGVTASRWTDIDENISEKKPGCVILEFERSDKDGTKTALRISVEYQSEKGPRGGNTGTTADQAARAIHWHVKALFDAIEFGIITMEQLTLLYGVTNQGMTMAEIIEQKPAILQQIISGDGSLLALEYRGK